MPPANTPVPPTSAPIPPTTSVPPTATPPADVARPTAVAGCAPRPYEARLTMSAAVKVHNKTRTQTRTQLRARRMVLYSVRATGQSSSCGADQGCLTVTYRGKKAVAGTLTLMVGVGKQATTATARVTIQPRT
jgi:hypothetical protein